MVATVQCATWVLYCLLTPGRTAPGVTNGVGVAIEARAAALRREARSAADAPRPPRPRAAPRARQGTYCALFLRYVPAGAKRAVFARLAAGAAAAWLLGVVVLFLAVPRACPSPQAHAAAPRHDNVVARADDACAGAAPLAAS